MSEMPRTRIFCPVQRFLHLSYNSRHHLSTCIHTQNNTTIISMLKKIWSTCMVSIKWHTPLHTEYRARTNSHTLCPLSVHHFQTRVTNTHASHSTDFDANILLECSLNDFQRLLRPRRVGKHSVSNHTRKHITMVSCPRCVPFHSTSLALSSCFTPTACPLARALDASPRRPRCRTVVLNNTVDTPHSIVVLGIPPARLPTTKFVEI